MDFICRCCRRKKEAQKHQVSRQFKEACQESKKLNLDQPSQLFLYGLYKQAYFGDCQEGLTIDLVKRAKDQAWRRNRGMSSEQAQVSYICILNKLREQSLEEQVGQEQTMGNLIFRKKQQPDQSEQDQNLQSLRKAIEAEDCQAIRQLLTQFPHLLALKNKKGIDPLIFAVDKEKLQSLKTILDFSPDRLSKDSEGNTALDYAILLENEEIIQVLAQAQFPLTPIHSQKILHRFRLQNYSFSVSQQSE